MSDHHPTRSLPFGRDVDILILCKDEVHRRAASEALRIPARYEMFASALTGYRFNKIIVLLGGTGPWSEIEIELIGRMIREDYPTHLRPGGKIYGI